MKRYHVPSALLLSALIVAIPDVLQGGTSLLGGAAQAPENITLENWAPYYRPPIAVAHVGILIRWVNPTASRTASGMMAVSPRVPVPSIRSLCRPTAVSPSHHFLRDSTPTIVSCIPSCVAR